MDVVVRVVVVVSVRRRRRAVAFVGAVDLIVVETWDDDDDADDDDVDARGRSGDGDANARIHSWATRGRRRVWRARGDARARGGTCGEDARCDAMRCEWVGDDAGAARRRFVSIGFDSIRARSPRERERDDDPSGTRASGVCICVNSNDARETDGNALLFVRFADEGVVQLEAGGG